MFASYTRVCPNEDTPWNSSDHHITEALAGLKGALNWVPIMPRHASLSDSGCEFFPVCIQADFLTAVSDG